MTSTTDIESLKNAERRGKPYVAAVQHRLRWDEFKKTHAIPSEGETILVQDPDTKKIHRAVVTRVATNGIRATILDMPEGLISVDSTKIVGNQEVWV